MATRAADTELPAESLRVPFTPASVPVARSRLRSWLSAAGCPREAIEDGRVIVSELVANALRHAQPLADGSLTVSWSLDQGKVEICVTDGGGNTYPHTIDASSSALAGRGMAIIETLAASWWTERSRSDQTVHAVLPLR